MEPQEILNKILAAHRIDGIHDAVQEVLLDYVDDDWEGEYESEYEWYIDHNNKEAEEDVVNSILRSFESTNGPMGVDTYCWVSNQLMECWELL